MAAEDLKLQVGQQAVKAKDECDSPIQIDAEDQGEADSAAEGHNISFDDKWPNTLKEEIALVKASAYLSKIAEQFEERPEPALIVSNEHGTKKLICTLIRPTAMAYPELSTWQGIANFISDHTLYQPLQEPTKQEEETVECEFAQDDSGEAERRKYCVQPRKQFDSKFIKSVQAQKENEFKLELALQAQLQRKKIEEEEKLPEDELEGQRVHYWLLVLPGICRPEVKEPFFIEAASGKPFSLQDENYLGVEYAWNHENFWFLKQKKNLKMIDFDFDNDEMWMRLVNLKEDNFELPLSWMERIEISQQDYQRRYPGEKKEIDYLRSKLLKYSEFSRPDGLVTELINYTDLHWQDAIDSASAFMHRKDFLYKSQINYENSSVFDYYLPGGSDYIKGHDYKSQRQGNREIHFYGKCHPLSLEKLTVVDDKVIENFEAKDDETSILKRVMMFSLNSSNKKIIEWTEEHYSVDTNFPLGQQVAQRKYFHAENRIFLRFHRNAGQLTSGYLHFLKPIEPNGTVELFHLYDPFDGGNERDLNLIFKHHLSDEQKLITHAQDIEKKIQTIMNKLFAERDNPGLKVSLFDEERNLDIVDEMNARDAALHEKFMRALLDPVDYTAPYVERTSDGSNNPNISCVAMLDDKILKEKTESNERAKQFLKNNISLLSSTVAVLAESEQKNQMLESERGEIKRIKFQIEALYYRLSRLNDTDVQK